MKLPIYRLDAFTDRLFGGNPAAVVLLDAWLPDGVPAAIAAENTLTAKQLSLRGGDLPCELNGDRVAIAGQVVQYLRGEIETEGSAISALNREGRSARLPMRATTSGSGPNQPSPR